MKRHDAKCLNTFNVFVFTDCTFYILHLEELEHGMLECLSPSQSLCSRLLIRNIYMYKIITSIK